MEVDGSTTEPEILVTKLDAAKRQLETAVRLFFHGGDPVSIHTLVEAGYELLETLNRGRGGQKMVLKEQFLEAVAKVNPGKVDAVRQKLNEAKNFFKHADRDPGGTINFRPTYSEILLWEACEKYHELTRETVPAFAVYRAYFLLTTGRRFELSEEVARVQKMFPPGDTFLANRPRFFDEMLPLAHKVPL